MSIDPAFVSTLSALAGTVIGGVTSFGSTWLTTTAQARAARLAADRNKREDLYGRFMDLLATLYADALQTDAVNYDNLIKAFALRGRISLVASESVFAEAEKALRFIVDLNLGARRSDTEMRSMMDDTSADVISAFALACRNEIERLR